jgi:hypothetical protein
MALFWEILWLILIFGSIIATIVVGIVGNSRRKAQYARPSASMDEDQNQMGFGAEENFDEFASEPIAQEDEFNQQR